MKKLVAVFKREYLMAVRKKSFWIMTVLAPFLMAAMMFIPSLMAMKGMGDRKVAILDGTGRLKGDVESGVDRALQREKPPLVDEEGGLGKRRSQGIPGALKTEYVAIGEGDGKDAAKPYLERLRAEDPSRKLDGVFVVPSTAFSDPKTRLAYYSRSATDLMTQERLGRLVNRALERQRLTERGLSGEDVERVLQSLSVDGIQVTKTGEQQKGGELNFLVGFVFVMLIFIPILMHGQEVLRGIIQEKTERIVEILVSSMSPMELLSGKILGMAAVGLTQIAIWSSMGMAIAAYGAAVVAVAGMNVMQFLKPSLAFYFLVFFVLGYLIYVCVYAVGGAIVNSEKEAQQVLTPVVLILMVPWFLVMPIIMSPDSTLSVTLSLIPIYTPITMFIRVLVSEPPLWQVALSILLSVGTVICLFWLTAKIFRVGILSYGKRPTIPELWRWVRLA